jgi:ubiquinone/menaquinone biosynthesis C-methylase UbiE
MTVWHERKDFWEKTAPFIFTKRHWESAVQDLDYLVERLGVKAGDAILDLCCGPGRHSLEFARRGYKVTGVDIMPAYLDEARTRADEEDLEVEFIREDARHFERMEAFHGAILMYTSFGYFEDRWENLRVLENVLGSLKPGGSS